MDVIACPICERSVAGRRRMEFTSPFNGKRYHLYRCAECEMEFWWPLELIPEFYESDFMEAQRAIHEDRTNVGVNMKLFFDHIPVKGGTLLDIGCGSGAFLKEAERRGYRVTGVELDAKSVEVCRRKGLRDIHHCTLAEFVGRNHQYHHSFDVVTFFEVLEHQDQPLQFLRLVRKLCRNGGYVALSVPNRDRLTIRLLNVVGRVLGADHAYALSTLEFPPHHLLRWSAGVLKRVLNLVGADDIRMWSIGLDYTGRVVYWRKAYEKATARLGVGHGVGRLLGGIVSRLLAVNPFGFQVSLYCQARMNGGEV
jgi:2-polyprenyl-3-methyl-5-hydroxy-6-metoxy-1,4-benzoquinol methylase